VLPDQLLPYSRALRPVLPQSLPQFLDAELQKIAVATANIVQVIQDLDDRIAAVEAQ